VNWQDRTELMLRAVAPHELAGRAVYIIDVDADAPPQRFHPRGCNGYFSAALPAWLKPWLMSRNQWRGGEAFATVVDLQRFSFRLVDPNLIAQIGLETVVHEFAHFVEWLSRFKVTRTAVEYPTDIAALVAWNESDDKNEPDEIPWENHSFNFVRCCLHLCSRLEKFINISRTNVQFAGRFYGLSPAVRYAEALGDEPERLKDYPLTTIMLIDPPKPFWELFDMDTAAHNAKQNHADSSHYQCNSCRAIRRAAKRQNHVVVRGRTPFVEVLECKNCGIQWTVDR
jgi:hypothetical protein